MANDKNNAKNLEALAKLKELGITDLSPEAVLAMVQSHLDTQSNLRKDNCQKQKEIDAKKAEIASQQDELIKAREERDTAQKNEQNLISIMGNCLGVLSKVEVKYNELLAQDSIPNIKTSDNEELNAYFLKLANLFVKMSRQQSTYVRGTKVNGESEKTNRSLPPGEAEEDFDSGYDENTEPKVAVDEGDIDSVELETADIEQDGDIEHEVDKSKVSNNTVVNESNPTVSEGTLHSVADAISKVNDSTLQDIDQLVDGDTGNASVLNDEGVVTPVENAKSNTMLKITPGTRIKMPCCNCERVQEMEVTNVIPRINEIIVKQGPNIVTANIAVGRAKCCNCGQYNEVNPADFVPIDRFEDPTAKAGTTIINQGTVISSSKPGQNPVVTQFEETTKNLEKQLDKHKEVLKPSQNSVRTQTQVSRREDAKSITNADTLIKSSIRFEDYLITNKYGDLVISPIIMNYCDGSDLPLFKKGKASEGVAIDMCAMNSILTVPKSRIAKFMEGCGCTFTPQNVINIINGFSRAFCAPIAKEILKDLLTKNKAAIMDETPLPVRENKKVTGHDSYIWAVHNGHTETIKASYFWFGDGRDSSNVTNIIESICKDDFNIDSLLADGFTGYNRAARILAKHGYKIKLARCFCHARRPLHKFLRDAGLLKIYEQYLVPLGSKFKDFKANLDKYNKDCEAKDSKLLKLSPLHQDLMVIYHLINTLFVLESSVVRKNQFNYTSADFTEDLIKVRKEQSAKIVDAIFDSIKLCILNNPGVINTKVKTTKDGVTKVTYNRKDTTIKGEGAALMYLLKYEDNLREFINNPRIDLSSNAVERSLRLGVCAKKVFEFLDSVDGAKAYCDYMTLVNTCLQNNVPVRSYFLWLVSNLKYRMSKWVADGNQDQDILDVLYKIPKRKEVTDANGNKKYIGMYDKSQRWCYDVLDVKGLTPYDYRDLILQEKAKMTA